MLIKSAGGGVGGGSDELTPRPKAKSPANQALEDGLDPKVRVGMKRLVM